MSNLISVVFVLILCIVVSTLGGCRQATYPDNEVIPEQYLAVVEGAPSEAASNPGGINHLSIASVEMRKLSQIDNTELIADVLAMLSDGQVSILARGYVIRVVETSLVVEIATIAGLDTSNPDTIREGIFMSPVPMSWGAIKCCYKDPECCPPPPKKEQ